MACAIQANWFHDMKQMQGNHARYAVKPVIGALKVLEVLVRAGEPMGLAELAGASGVSKTTTFRYLKTLGLVGYVIETSEKRFEIGPTAWLFGRYVGVERALRGLADHELKALLDRFGKTVNLAIPNGKRLSYVAILDPSASLTFTAEVGDSECFHCTALGKAILAFEPVEFMDIRLSTKLQRFTEHTITNRAALKRELGNVRRLGYAMDREENELGCICYAAPILTEEGLPVGALSVSVPTAQLTDALDLTIAEAVKDAAKQIAAHARRDEAILDFLQVLQSSRGRPSQRNRKPSRL